MSCPEKTTVDPLLRDLDEKKESFRRNVVSLAAELKQVRGRLVIQEQSFLKETITRKEAEKRGKNMEMEMCKLQKRLEERNCQLEASASAADKFIKELEEFRSKLDATKQTAEASADSAQSTQIQCSLLKKQLDDKTRSLREHEDRVTQLGHQLDDLQRGLSLRECSEKQLREEVKRIEREITESITKAGIDGMDCELQKLLEDVSPMKFERMNRLVEVKDEEITKLKDEIRLMSGHWKHKTKELESQLEKQRRTDQDLKKKVLKLEFCLQEARSQTRKLQRKGERRDMEIKEIRDLISDKQQLNNESWDKQKFWDNSGFKIVVSMSMLMLVVVSKR
ncbi:myosin heavy chain, striated muscle [Arabidopsis lyrata subsp. lyrata]|uniref:myosin heavy chain, striated muscle n=1 Tax=Arabidopsis lyrata subsp. lyrata TaxID=81972 RepID=UPI000A29DEAE|nr:myosin heavy chain, striated muscle [Arabidopsis lyrata subsp. lyrata]|eukprot:XP_020887893.1 myosin heavy chain, striated muscle [Arabidopsis lyrata subsp. lyrata]